MSLQMTRVLGNPNTWVEDLPINHGKSLHIFPLNLHVDGCESANKGPLVRVEVRTVRVKFCLHSRTSVHT